MEGLRQRFSTRQNWAQQDRKNWYSSFEKNNLFHVISEGLRFARFSSHLFITQKLSLVLNAKGYTESRAV